MKEGSKGERKEGRKRSEVSKQNETREEWRKEGREDKTGGMERQK